MPKLVNNVVCSLVLSVVYLLVECAVLLSPAQMFALRNTILSTLDFAKEQNLVIDKLSRGDRPFMYFDSLFEPEFQSLWIRNNW